MTENIMLYANQVPSSDKLSQYKPQPGKSLFQRSDGFDTTPSAQSSDQIPTQSSVPVKKPKQPFLKRGTGLQTRIAATKQRRYVPKGGFVKGQNDSEEQTAINKLTAQPIQHAGHYHRTQHPAHTPLQSTSETLQQAEGHDLTETSSSQMQPGWPAQDWASLQSQQFKRAAGKAGADSDLEAEMDADSALVHFPSRPGTQASQKLPSNREQTLQSNFLAPQALQHLHVPIHNQNDNASMTSSTRASLSQLHPLNPSIGAAASEWQLQQAAEV